MSARCPAGLAALCLVAVLAVGCAPLGIGPGMDTEAPPKREERRPDPAEARLAEAASRAEAALTAFARIRAEQAPPRAAGIPAEAPGRSPVPGSLPVPPELRRPVTLDWIGPVETLAEALARRAGYRFLAAGPMPVRPATVAVRAEDTPLIEVLRDAGLQAGRAATLVVNAGDRVVRLDWRGELPHAEARPHSRERTGPAPGKEGS